MSVSVSPSHIAAQALAAQSRIATPQPKPTATPTGFQALALKSVQATRIAAATPVDAKPAQTNARENFAALLRQDVSPPSSTGRPVRPGTNLDIRV